MSSTTKLCTAGRLEIQKSEWEKADDERKKRAAEFRMREDQREREKTSLGEGQTVVLQVLPVLLLPVSFT